MSPSPSRTSLLAAMGGGPAPGSTPDTPERARAWLALVAATTRWVVRSEPR
jgi:hypothetical protein